MWRKLEEELRAGIMGYFQLYGPHDFSHTERVYRMAVSLAEYERADMEIVAISALLHDIARKMEQEKREICHAEEGAKIAGGLLKGKSKKVDEIMYSIKTHRFRNGIIPETHEARILQDADRLDSLGAVAIARTFSQDGVDGKPIYDPLIPPNRKYTGSSATGINHLHEKILNIKPDGFHTEKAKEAAKMRYEVVKTFVTQFEDEWMGKI